MTRQTKFFSLVSQPALVAIFLLAIIVAGASTLLAQIPEPDQQADYSEEIKNLLATTYLGHAAQFPDPGEPLEVLRAYVERDNYHTEDLDLIKSQADGAGGFALPRPVVKWQALSMRFPKSRHAFAALGEAYQHYAELTLREEWLRKAAQAYVRAANLGLEHGRIRYTQEIASLLLKLEELETLDGFFQNVLDLPPEVDSKYAFLARVDYADALAKLDGKFDTWWRAEQIFLDAIALQPHWNVPAINVYVEHLLARGQAQQALDILDGHLVREQRIRNAMPTRLRHEALSQLGLDTAEAEAEVTEMQAFFKTPDVLTPEEYARLRTQKFAHSNSSDDCRSTSGTALCLVNAIGLYVNTIYINLAEIMYNEARSENPGAMDEVGWTVRDRAYNTVRTSSGSICGTFVGGFAGGTTTNTCLSSVPGGGTIGGSTSNAQKYCCAAHGGTTSSGTSQLQFDDTHRSCSTLNSNGSYALIEAIGVIKGTFQEVASYYNYGTIPPGVSNCTFVGTPCGTVNNANTGPVCWSGSNYTWPSGAGAEGGLPYEFRSTSFTLAYPSCMQGPFAQCGNGGSENLFGAQKKY